MTTCSPGEAEPCLPAGAVYPDTWSLELVLDTSSLHSLFLLKQREALDEAELLTAQQLLPPNRLMATMEEQLYLQDTARIHPWDGAEKGKGVEMGLRTDQAGLR